MITSYVLLIVLTMPGSMPDVKMQIPAENVQDCLLLASEYSARLVTDKTVAAMIRCQPVMDAPAEGHSGEHVD